MTRPELPAPSTPSPRPTNGPRVSANITNPQGVSPNTVGATPIDPYATWSDTSLRAEAEALGAPVPFDWSREEVIATLQHQKHLIAGLDETVLLEIAAWSGHKVVPNAADGLAARKERLAKIAAKIRTMRFAGLSQEGLRTLAIIRGIPVRGDEPVPVLVAVLKSQEGIKEKLQRKGRSLLGHLAEKFIGQGDTAAADRSAAGKRLKHEIEDQGLLGGITSRLKRSADGYVQEKLDEIESRIDRKLDEIDRRLCDWRDKEIANRIRIIKITLWASVVISALSLLYMYLKQHLS